MYFKLANNLLLITSNMFMYVHNFLLLMKYMYDFSFGGGGGKATKWSLCVLPLNMINQKFYSFFYFWLFFLMITSLTTLVIRIGLIGSPSLREISTKFHFDGIKFKVCFMIVLNWVICNIGSLMRRYI